MWLRLTAALTCSCKPFASHAASCVMAVHAGSFCLRCTTLGQTASMEQGCALKGTSPWGSALLQTGRRSGRPCMLYTPCMRSASDTHTHPKSQFRPHPPLPLPSLPSSSTLAHPSPILRPSLTHSCCPILASTVHALWPNLAWLFVHLCVSEAQAHPAKTMLLWLDPICYHNHHPIVKHAES